MNINELKFDNLHTDILEYIPQFLNFKNVLNLSQVSRNLFNSCLAFQKNYAIDRVNSYLKSVTVEEIRNCQMGNLSKLKICKNIFEVEVETIYKRVLIDLFINDSSNQRGKLFNERGKIVESFNSNFPLDYHTRKQISTTMHLEFLICAMLIRTKRFDLTY